MQGKTILATGGTGSFGQAFTREALDRGAERVRVYSRTEFGQVQMQQAFIDAGFPCQGEPNSRLRFIIGDVRDGRRLKRAMEGCDIVVHAAALKHVPICEYNPIEAIKTNIDGTMNVIESALDSGTVKKVIAISSDKACHPINLYGKTKAVMEALVVQANAYRGKHGPRFACTRYGNVLTSRGSVVDVWREQAAKGLPLTITDPLMTRFLLTVQWGAKFVADCLDRMEGGEIFVPLLPSAWIMDVAEAVAGQAPNVRAIGRRPGEKLHETLIAVDEAHHVREYLNERGEPDHYVITPEYPFWKRADSGRCVLPGWSYTSEVNDNWLDAEAIRGML